MGSWLEDVSSPWLHCGWLYPPPHSRSEGRGYRFHPELLEGHMTLAVLAAAAPVHNTYSTPEHTLHHITHNPLTLYLHIINHYIIYLFNQLCIFLTHSLGFTLIKSVNSWKSWVFAEFHKKWSSTQKLLILTRSHDPAHNSSHDSTHNVTFNHNLLRIPYVCVLFKSGQ